MKEVYYLTLEQILVIHDDQIERYGGSHGIRDLALLESAVMRPQASFGGKDLYSSFFRKAAVLVHSLIKNHPFVDGNKRTSVVSVILFFEQNGFRLDIGQKELVDFALGVEAGELDVNGIVVWLKKHSSKMKGK